MEPPAPEPEMIAFGVSFTHVLPPSCVLCASPPRGARKRQRCADCRAQGRAARTMMNPLPCMYPTRLLSLPAAAAPRKQPGVGASMTTPRGDRAAHHTMPCTSYGKIWLVAVDHEAIVGPDCRKNAGKVIPSAVGGLKFTLQAALRGARPRS